MPHLYLLPYIAVGGFIGLLLASAYSDVKRLIIPNQYTIAIALLFPAYGLSSPGSVDWLGSALVAGGLLVVGFFLFCKKVTGGGDVKLVVATALWAGPELVLPFLLYTGAAGGAMAGAIWLRHRFSAAGTPLTFLSLPARKEFYDQPMPYGVAIAVGGIYVAFTILGLW
jgi:prepilin peptidase CpaA